MFIVPPFFWPDDDPPPGLLAAGPANAAATSIAAPSAAIATESQTLVCIDLLSLHAHAWGCDRGWTWRSDAPRDESLADWKWANLAHLCVRHRLNQAIFATH